MTKAIRAAGIDCGTNSIRLLIADVDPERGRLTDVTRRMEIVRLGQGVDRTGRFAPEALARTLAAVARYGQICRRAGVERLRFVATSATRDAANRDLLLDGVRRELAVEAQVIDGLEEARLSFAGALSALPPGLPGPYLCVDLGGGSTELVLGAAEPAFAFSMDVGCVRVTERHLRSDPPTAQEVKQAADAVDGVLDAAAGRVPLGRAATVIGLAGSITTITAHALGLTSYQPERIDGAILAVGEVLRACRELWELSRSQRAGLGFMHPGRVDVIGAGALVWSRVLERVGREVAAAGGRLDRVVTSEHDILDGIALTAARSGEP